MNELKHPYHGIAKEIAKKHVPVFIAQIESDNDFPNAFGSDRESPYTKPPVYWWVRENKTHYYIGYALYYPYDANHKHDFQGLIVEALKEKEHSLLQSKQIYRTHFSLTYNKSFIQPIVFIKPGSHSFEAFGWRDFLGDNKTYLRFCPNILTSTNLQNKRYINLEARRKVFKPWVTLPDEWYDKRLENYVRRYSKKPVIDGVKITTTKELLWKRPDLLFRLMEKRAK